MKISTKGTSRVLAQEDLPSPRIVTMDRVTLDQTLRNPYLLHFTAEAAIKPLPLNVTNRRVLVVGYGDDDAGWHGQQVEVYVDPNVTNSRGEVVGGIRVRVPQAQSPAPVAARPQAPAPLPLPKPAPAPMPAQPRPAAQVLPEHRLQQVLAGIGQCLTPKRVNEWVEFAGEFDWPEAIQDSIADAAAERLAALTRQQGQRPAMAK